MSEDMAQVAVGLLANRSGRVGSEGEERRQLAQAAANAAKQRLMATYSDEYEELVMEERAARGLPAERTALQRAEARVRELEAELAALSREKAAD